MERECRLTGDVVDHHSDTRVSDVGGDEGSKSFLAGGIPELKPHCPVFQIHGLYPVSPDAPRLARVLSRITLERKSMPIVAWYMLSKESYMNRVIKDVLPTVATCQSKIDRLLRIGQVTELRVPLCSPKKTSLQPNTLARQSFTNRPGHTTQNNILELLERVVV